MLVHSIVTRPRMIPCTKRDYFACLSNFITKLTVKVIRDFHGTAKISVGELASLIKSGLTYLQVVSNCIFYTDLITLQTLTHLEEGKYKYIIEKI